MSSAVAIKLSIKCLHKRCLMPKLSHFICNESWTSCLIWFPTLCTSVPANSSAPEKDVQLKSHYDQLLLGVEKDLEKQKAQFSRTQQELNVQRELVKAKGFHFLTIYSFGQFCSRLKGVCFCAMTIDLINTHLIFFEEYQ